MESKETIFRYPYSAPEQDEVKKIRKKYLPKEESKLERLAPEILKLIRELTDGKTEKKRMPPPGSRPWGS